MRRIFWASCLFVFVASCITVGVLAWGTGLHLRPGADGQLEVLCGPGGVPLAAAEQAAAEEDRALSPLAFFTGGGNYMPRVHCMVNEAGATDWPWVWTLLGMNALVIAGYAKIFVFWRKSYLQERHEDRNKKLMQMAWIFAFCAVCGYAASIMMFVWPAYRLLALLLVPLAAFTWLFCMNLDEMKVSLSAKRLERELREALEARAEELERQVEARTSELKIARDEAHAASEAKGKFIATVSHEIRTPLNAIMGYSSMLAENTLTPSARADYAGIIERNGRHLATVINDVLDQSKIESGSVEIESAPCSPEVIVGDVITLLRPTAEAKDIELEATTPTGIPSEVIGDHTRIRQVLLNLVSNAVKFTESGSVRVIVHAETEGDRCMLRFVVEDTGIGMSPEQAEKVFDPFKQAEPGTTRQFGGTGLGLTISRSLCELMGGTITVESEQGKGSSFTATLWTECAENAEWNEAFGSDTATRRALNMSSIPTLAGRVLIADDSVDNRRLFVMALRKAGLVCVEAGDGFEAIAAVEKADRDNEPVDMVLMDLDMPNCDGETAMRRIKATHRDLPIVALSAHASKGLREQLLKSGFNEYASKPIARSALVALCAQWIGPRRDAA